MARFKPVRTAVFPVAGRGTRFLPATKAMPKEMLPIVDKPLIQYAVEEALAAGATRLVFITGSTKRSIEDHFDRDAELERALEAAGKQQLLGLVRNILPNGVSCVYIRQGEPLGLGHAVLCARPAVGDEPFFVHLPDDLIRARTSCLAQMRGHYEQHGASVLAVEDVPAEKTSSYGIVDADSEGRLRRIVEKPAPDKAPSTLAVVGRYLLTPAIFDMLENIGRGAGGEIQLTDGIAALLRQEPVHAFRFAGRRYDCGSKLGYVEAIVDFAMEDQALRESLKAHLAAHR
ncbi:MAG: UTP--glucose-1-phosphate uridylyltransferase GalU [Gammaproteobacteria bacterium]|nr:MAG: UTP--glucose-1-phosphate uridylyltransferase GalU [Gammaproteobacteria bacterium]